MTALRPIRSFTRWHSDLQSGRRLIAAAWLHWRSDGTRPGADGCSIGHDPIVASIANCGDKNHLRRRTDRHNASSAHRGHLQHYDVLNGAAPSRSVELRTSLYFTRICIELDENL